MENSNQSTTLRRVLGLPMMVFYGVGVTIGAGIFALIGEITRIAGDHAPLAFLIAGVIAGATGLSYAKLASVYPRAAGEAVFVKIGLGDGLAQLVGYGVTLTAIISSAVIAIAFSGYLGSLLPIPQPLMVLGILLLLATIAWFGVRESVAFAAIVTLIEVGVLVVIAVAGAPLLADSTVVVKVFSPPADSLAWAAVFSSSIIAFFAFVGFEDIVNMAEEIVEPDRVLPRAIIYTLVITMVLYVVIASIAIALPDREALTSSSAPMAVLFESVTGSSGKPIAAMAAIAMINGILVQVVMASRVLYGMAREGLAPEFLSVLDTQRRTPARAIFLVTSLITVLALALPLVSLAQATSVVTLCVFTLVNLALWRIGSREDSAPVLQRWRYWGVFGAVLSIGLLSIEVIRLLS